MKGGTAESMGKRLQTGRELDLRGKIALYDLLMQSLGMNFYSSSIPEGK